MTVLKKEKTIKNMMTALISLLLLSVPAYAQMEMMEQMKKLSPACCKVPYRITWFPDTLLKQ
jgi:hypothetical protein